MKGEAMALKVGQVTQESLERGKEKYIIKLYSQKCLIKGV